MDHYKRSLSKVLIIEDEEAISEMISMVFEQAGYKTIQGKSAEEALDKLSKVQVDLITLDIMLPGMNGFEFLKQVKKDLKLKDIPIIVLSARGQEEDKVKGLELGAIDYVTKPFSPKELNARLAVHLRHSTAGMVVRYLEFPPEYHSAGVNILSYFSTFLRKNYKNIEAAVRIEQEGLNVRMIVDPLNGDSITIEKALSEYGHFFNGTLPAEAITENQFLIVELKQQKRMAEMQLEHTQELLEIERRHNHQLAIQSKSVNEQYNEVVKTISRSLESKQGELKELKSIINSVAKNVSSASKDALIFLESKFEEGISKEDESEVKKALVTLSKNDPSVFEKITRFIESSASGVIGNYVYNWMISLSMTLPK